MTWVTLDDTAPEHEKQLAAGHDACWLWVCGLAYCYRKDSQDGFIPKAKVELLYPRLGLKQAKRLVEVGLWEETDLGYVVHDYLEWKDRRFNGRRSVRGSAGGSVSSEAKRAAAAKREADKRLARQGTTGDHNEKHNEAQQTVLGVVSTSTSPTASGLSDLPSGVSGSLPSPDPDPAESFRSARETGQRPRPRQVLLAVRIEGRLYVPLEAHWDYAADLGLTREEAERALLDLRDKFGGKRHDETWLDDKFCAFLEQATRSKFNPKTNPGRLTPADERTQRQLERVAELRAQEAAEDARKAGAA